ncbi:MAG: hypothetical protein ACK41R_03660 [Thermus sp.]
MPYFRLRFRAPASDTYLLPLPQDLLPLLRAWTEGRGPLKPSPKAFHQLWQELEE